MTPMQIVEILDGEQKSRFCANIIRTLPGWFGIPEANEHFVSEVASKDVFAAVVGHRAVGLIALHYHFEKTAEIWWLGVRPEHHRQGIGKQLLAAAKNRAIQKGCSAMAVATVSPRSSDEGYAKTRALYKNRDFRFLVEFNENDPANPMVWMILRLGE
jgi:GNAT superfamily N-acetyltransferase